MLLLRFQDHSGICLKQNCEEFAKSFYGGIKAFILCNKECLGSFLVHSKETQFRMICAYLNYTAAERPTPQQYLSEEVQF